MPKPLAFAGVERIVLYTMVDDPKPKASTARASELRLAFFTQGVHTPASRFRAAQLVPGLGALGVRCTLLPARPSVYGDVDLGWVHGWRRELVRPLSVWSRLLQLGRIRDFDVVILQRPMIEYYTTLFEEVVTRARPCVFDLDDAIFHNFFELERFKVRRIIQLVRHVVVGNRYLYDFVNAPTRTTLIPTVVDTARYVPRSDPGGRFTIGWTGTSGNLRELEPVVGALRTVLRTTGGELLIISDRCDASWLRDLPVRFVRWSPETETRALAEAHVGVMPLADTPYNRGKCGFKLIQCMARAIPVVAAPVGANLEIVRPGVDGHLARTAGEWIEALLALARDPAARARLGAAGRARIEQHYSVEVVLPTYRELIGRLAGEG